MRTPVHPPGGGTYEATVTIADDRGVTGTCSSADLGVDALYPRVLADRRLRDRNLQERESGHFSQPRGSVAQRRRGGGHRPHDAMADRTNALTVRAGGGFAHNFWIGSSLDLILTRQTPGGSSDWEPAPGESATPRFSTARYSAPRVQPAQLHRRRADAGVRRSPAVCQAHQRAPEQLLRHRRIEVQLQADARTPGSLTRP